MSAVMPFFQWCDGAWVANAIRNSRVAFPIIENIHLFALTVLLGSVVVLSLRQFNLALTGQSVAEVAAHLKPWNRLGLVVILVSGILLFLSEAMKCYSTTSFRVKMIFLFFALIFQFTIYNRLVVREQTYRVPPRESGGRHCFVFMVWSRTSRPCHRLPGIVFEHPDCDCRHR
jgi:hypothetical protein